MNKLFYGVLFSALFLAACKKEDVKSTSIYDCKDQPTVTATFTNGKIVALVTGEGEEQKTVTLNRVESDSGAKYASADETIIFWSKGREANYVPEDGAEPWLCMRRQ